MNAKKTNDKKTNPMRHSHTARLKAFFETFFSRKLVVVGFIIIMMIIVIAIFASLLTQYDPLKSSLKEVLRKPSLLHPFGTDDLGRDILTRIFYGARVSLVVGIASTLVAGVVGMIVGLIAGYAGGVVDSVIMRIMDAMLAIPIIILALFLGSALGKGLGNIILCIGISMIPRYARVTRGSVLQVKKLDYVTASKISGASKIKIARVHILKNCLSSNLVMMTMNLGDAILTEASLSYLGMGINPPTPSWGGMVSNGYDWLSMNPTVAIAPGIFIILTVWAFNVCGDALRDALDPKLKGIL